MNNNRRLTALILAAVMLMSLAAAPTAMAATGINQQGRPAAQLGTNLFIAIKNNDIAVLNTVALSSGDFTRIDTNQTISELVTTEGSLYYLRTDAPATQLIKTSGDGSALAVLAQWDNAQVTGLSFYDEFLYCLVNGVLTMVDPANGDSDEVLSDITMEEYVILNDVVYFTSATDTETYTMTSSGKTATGTAGKLYIAGLYTTATSTAPQCIQEFGAEKLSAYGDNIYMHNLSDGYITESSEGDVWVEGRLYRMNAKTNQVVPMGLPYDWRYYPTAHGVVVYTNRDISLYPLTGGAAKQLMTPDIGATVTADDSAVYVFEPVSGILTSIPLPSGEAKQLYTGGPLTELTDNTDNKGQEMLLDENGDPVLDEDGNYVYVQPDNTGSDDDLAYYPDDDDDDSSSSSSSSGSKKDSSYIFAHSNTKKLTRQQILDTSKSYWRRARNEIYARHGYQFKDKSLREYFSGKSWYKPGGFSQSKLNKTEWYNMDLIKAMEKEFGLLDDKDSSSSGSTSSSSGRIKLSKNVFANSSTKKLTSSQVKKLSASKLATARNEILARHGYPFKTAKWKKYFTGTGWKSRSSFSYNDLNSIEMYNIELIKKYE